MKTLLFLGLLATTQPTTETRNHQPETVLSTQAKTIFRGNSTTVDVRVQKPLGKGATLSLSHREGGLVHHETIARNQSNALLRLHLHELPEGTYDLVVNDHKHRTVLRQELVLRTKPASAPVRELAVNIP